MLFPHLIKWFINSIFLVYPGGSTHMTQYFRGNLAGLMIRTGKLENKKVIDCLYTCKEGLDVQLPEEVASAVKVWASYMSIIDVEVKIAKGPNKSTMLGSFNITN